MVSQGTGGRVMATVTLGGGSAEVSSAGADLALALIGALAEALVEALAEARGGTDHDQRLARPSEVSLRLN